MGVDFSREIFFRHTVFYCVAFLMQKNKMRSEKIYGSEFHEGEKYTATGYFHVAAHGDLHGGKFPV